MDRLKDKVVILSGGNSGIGACAAKLFAAEGAKVVISARRVEALDAVAEEIRQAGGEVLAIPCDISKPEQCAAVVAKTVETFGTVDVLVNNAGVLDSGLDAIEKISDETIDRLVDTNTKGTLYLTREAAKVLMAKKSGSIVNVASVAGYCGNGGACGQQGSHHRPDQEYCHAGRFRQCALQRGVPRHGSHSHDRRPQPRQPGPRYDGRHG